MIRTCEKCGEERGEWFTGCGHKERSYCRCERRSLVLMVAAILLMVAAVACFLQKKSEGAVDVEKVAKALRHESNSRARKVTAANPKTGDEWALYHYYGISPEEIRKGQVGR